MLLFALRNAEELCMFHTQCALIMFYLQYLSAYFPMEPEPAGLIQKEVFVPCEEEIHCKIRIGCNKFYYILRTVLIFVQNVILKDKTVHSKHFATYCLFWNALGIKKERNNATRQKECRKLPNRLSYLNRQKEKAFYFPTWFSTASADGTMRIDSTQYVKHGKRLHSSNMMPQQFGVWHS